MWLIETDEGVTLQVIVQPRASRAGLGPLQGDRLKLRVTAAPVDGAANEAVVKLLAQTFRVPRRDVVILAGQTGRRKTIQIRGVTAAIVEETVKH